MEADMTEGAELVLEIIRILPAPPDLVFKAWQDDDLRARWFCPRDIERTEGRHDFTEGGEISCDMWDAQGKHYRMRGAYTEITPPTRLVFTHFWEEPDGAVTVKTICTVQFAAHPKGTELTFTQTGFTRSDARDSHADGWAGMLDNLHIQLAVMAATGTLVAQDLGETEVLLTRQFAASAEQLFKAHTDAELLVKWMSTPMGEITRCQIDPQTGGSFCYEWTLPDGAVMQLNGRFVSVAPPHKLVHTESWVPDWTNGEITVETRLIPMGANQTVLAMLLTYPSTEARKQNLATPMIEGMEMTYSQLDGLI